jgi:hypothetical protein
MFMGYSTLFSGYKCRDNSGDLWHLRGEYPPVRRKKEGFWRDCGTAAPLLLIIFYYLCTQEKKSRV